jgi:hypothetical protein
MKSCRISLFTFLFATLAYGQSGDITTAQSNVLFWANGQSFSDKQNVFGMTTAQ